MIFSYMVILCFYSCCCFHDDSSFADYLDYFQLLLLLIMLWSSFLEPVFGKQSEIMQTLYY